MKRILFFLLLLVNLQLTTDNGSLSIGLGEIAAQSMKEETLDNVTVNGGSNWVHCGCGKYFDRTYLNYHLENECPLRTYICGKCKKPYRWNEAHSCPNSYYTICHSCNNPLNRCICKGRRCAFCGKETGSCLCSINGVSGIGGGGRGGGGGAGSSGGTLRGQVGVNSYGLKGKKGVTILKNLPDELYAQTPNTQECSIRALAFLLSLKGYDYQTIFNKLKNTVVNGYNIDLDRIGLKPSQVKKIFQKEYNLEIIPRDDYTVSNIQSYINQNIGVVTYIQVTESLLDNNGNPEYDQYGNIKTRFRQHYVTIIGYDDSYFYAAAGNADGSASIYTLTELTHNELYIIR